MHFVVKVRVSNWNTTEMIHRWVSYCHVHAKDVNNIPNRVFIFMFNQPCMSAPGLGVTGRVKDTSSGSILTSAWGCWWVKSKLSKFASMLFYGFACTFVYIYQITTWFILLFSRRRICSLVHFTSLNGLSVCQICFIPVFIQFNYTFQRSLDTCIHPSLNMPLFICLLQDSIDVH